MRYSTPYNDKITLPHIKKINTIGINTDNLYYDSRELSGQVIIDGEYLTDNDEEIMAFTHDLPVSILIDDADVEPEIHISNFKYELIPGVGLEVMFELDMILIDTKAPVKEPEEALNKRIEDIDQQLAQNKQNLEKLSHSSPKEEAKRKEKEVKVEQTDQDAVEFKNKIDQNLEKLIGDRKAKDTKKKKEKQVKVEEEKEIEVKEVKIEEDKEVEVKEVKIEEEKEIEIKQVEVKEINAELEEENEVEVEVEVNVDVDVEVNEEEEVEREEDDKNALLEVIDETIEQEAKEIEVLVEQEEVKAEVVAQKLTTKLHGTSHSFDTGFLSSHKDRFTTYKIIMLDSTENIDEVLERKNLSRALVCDEYESDSSKVILKIENDGN